MSHPSRFSFLLLTLAFAVGCGQNNPTSDSPNGSKSTSNTDTPSAGMQWAATEHFRGEVSRECLASAGSLMTPTTVINFADVRSGLMVQVRRADPQANPMPMGFHAILFAPKQAALSNQFIYDSLVAVTRRSTTQSDEAIQVGGFPGTRIVSIVDEKGTTASETFAVTPQGVIAISALLPAEDYKLVLPELNRFTSSFKLLP